MRRCLCAFAPFSSFVLSPYRRSPSIACPFGSFVYFQFEFRFCAFEWKLVNGWVCEWLSLNEKLSLRMGIVAYAMIIVNVSTHCHHLHNILKYYVWHDHGISLVFDAFWNCVYISLHLFGTVCELKLFRMLIWIFLNIAIFTWIQFEMNENVMMFF